MNQQATVIICDEFASVRKFPVLLEAIGRMRGYGVIFWIFLQYLSQGKEIYGEGHRILTGNVVQYFGGTGDDLTAQQMATYSGKKTEPVPGTSRSVGVQPGGSDNWSLIGRDVVMPDEVMRWPLPYQLVHVAGKGITIGVVIDPSLRDFPDYLSFMRVIEAEGTARQAVSAAMQVRAGMAQPRRTPPPAPAIVQQRKREHSDAPRGLSKWIASIMGNDTE